MERLEKKKRHTFLAMILAGVLFILCIGVFLFQILILNEQDNESKLQDAVIQNKTAIEKQIDGDIQTLLGISYSIADRIDSAFEDMEHILRKINDNNSFLQMGIINSRGVGELVELEGNYYEKVDFSQEPIFIDALEGRPAMDTIDAAYMGEEQLIGVAVPLQAEEGPEGVLFAANRPEIYANILNTPIFDGYGLSCIVNRAGQVVIHSEHSAQLAESLARLAGELEEAFLAASEASKKQTPASTVCTIGDGQYYLAFEPLDAGGWFVVGAVPKSLVHQTYGKLVAYSLTFVVVMLLFFLVIYYRMNTQEQKHRNRLEELAYTDPLTGNWNLNKFRTVVQDYIRKRHDRDFVVWYCDIKKFKYFNDMFGYHEGDRILKCLSSVFLDSVNEDEYFCRTSADNFVGIIGQISRAEFTDWFDRLAAAVNYWGETDARGFCLEIVIGAYCAGEFVEHLSLNDMIDRAKIAQESVKEMGGSRVAFYSEEMRGLVYRETELESRMRAALKNREFVLYFQPKVNIQQQDRIAGAEVLARWQTDQELISPGVFIPVFEKNGFIVSLDRYMFENACIWLADHLKNGGQELNIAVNVSRLGLLQPDFVDYYVSVKNRYGIPDGLLELEFTESIILEDIDIFCSAVLELKKQGFLCSLDDFGAGYSSLNILKNLPLDILKLDVLFFREGVDIKRERIVISHVVSMARELRMRTIAEGVESVEQVDFLRNIGCDVVQGYVFAKPMPVEKFRPMLERCRDGYILKDAGGIK
ncbi:bifunctional diguanylate cyclase/phosphodiesterase [Lachnotalea sp. AF33-28]|uniref:bifunctional diguanylate cyclase/phosphodiesterase n=1 Tax=Lachnotalea sp. AF33-28 TaxID=2292046 RepID=UPI000E4B2D72|nr:EAL domain-containing protein [Lachnotalea sp. AF33-28]RHP34891.1 EAL domain-containing protein [Lachnotalea sp. AF33-28]